jgi:hypothetical protein
MSSHLASANGLDLFLFRFRNWLELMIKLYAVECDASPHWKCWIWRLLCHHDCDNSIGRKAAL